MRKMTVLQGWHENRAQSIKPFLALHQSIAIVWFPASFLAPTFSSSLQFLVTALIMSQPTSKTFQVSFINYSKKAPNSYPGVEDAPPSGPSLHFQFYFLALCSICCVPTKWNYLPILVQAPVPVALVILELVLSQASEVPQVSYLSKCYHLRCISQSPPWYCLSLNFILLSLNSCGAYCFLCCVIWAHNLFNLILSPGEFFLSTYQIPDL